MVYLCDLRFMVWNEEEDSKSPFNGWLKAYNIDIDLEELIFQNHGPKNRNRDLQMTRHWRDSTRPKVPRAIP